MKFLSGLRPVLIAPSDQISSLVIAGLLAIVIGGSGHMLGASGGTDLNVGVSDLGKIAAGTEPAQTAASAATPSPDTLAAPETVTATLSNLRDFAVAALPAAVKEEPKTLARQIEIKRGHTLAQILDDADVDANNAHAIVAALRQVYDLRSLRAGLDMTLHFARAQGQEKFTGLTFQPGLTEEITVAQNAAGDGWEAVRAETPVERHRFAAHGNISSSLYEAGDRAGVPLAVMAALIRIYSHEIDFQRDLRDGDAFEVMYDQPMLKSGPQAGTAVGEGTVIYAALKVGGVRKTVYRVVFSDNTAEYFNERGESIRRALLRTPVDGARMTSSFGMRRHPILGYSKMHKGIDFGAPTGTPIYAAGDGVIESIGTNGSYGRYIRIRHNGKMATAYAHMKRFSSSLKRGSKVKQGTVIGYVGTSGRSTGPHLHYEVLINRQQVNPLSINTAAGRTLDGRMLAQFKQGITQINGEFKSVLAGKSGTPAAIQVASKK
ncbi:MAG: peptidoglycan DD-metalloendopeptidase family protein [Alphaproteobacteria bacterium]|nr:peptidoglycan DD-metalloendopeptidase family protein [Alphaproteobacteria bacterium]